MRKWKVIGLLAALALPLASGAISRNPAPAAGAKTLPGGVVDGSADGFVGMLMITPDADWEAKWKTPSANIPRFTTTQEVGRGGKVYILTFISNPKLDASGHANVLCDLDVIRPDGSFSQHEKDLPCYQGKYPAPSTSLALTALVVEFTGDPGDPAGKWNVKVRLRDTTRHVEVPLETWFELKE